MSSWIGDLSQGKKGGKKVHQANWLRSAFRGNTRPCQNHGNSECHIGAAALVLPVAGLFIENLSVIRGDGDPAPCSQNLSIKRTQGAIDPAYLPCIGPLLARGIMVSNRMFGRGVWTMGFSAQQSPGRSQTVPCTYCVRYPPSDRSSWRSSRWIGNKILKKYKS